jgi:DNA-binding GntR family transcriptional regulator
VSTPTATTAATERLRRAIIRAELPPSAAMSEQQLTDRFGLSKAAVRAALARLRGEGLVHAEPRRGHVVAPLTLRDVREVYDLRLLVEPGGAAAATGHVDTASLERLVDTIAAPVDVDDPDAVDRFLAANRQVHVTIAEAAGNRRLASLVERLLDESERALVVALHTGIAAGGLRVHHEHLTIVGALRLGDPAGAARAMENAIRRFRADLLDKLAATPAILDATLTTGPR